MSPNLPSVLAVDFNNVEEVDRHIKQCEWRINGLTTKKKAAMSLTEFYNYSKLIRAEQATLKHALIMYKNLEIKHKLPVNITYRAWLKVLLR